MTDWIKPQGWEVLQTGSAMKKSIQFGTLIHPRYIQNEKPFSKPPEARRGWSAAAWDEGFEAAQLDYSGRVVTFLVPMCRKPDACFAYRMIGWTI
jgi:hypothetical protein